MPADRRDIREIRSIYQGLTNSQIYHGQWAQWFRFNTAATTSNETYGTGPQRAWYNYITIPVWDGIVTRQPLNLDGEGLYLVNQVTLVMSYYAFFSSTIPDPDPSGQDHLNDRVGFDGTLYRVLSFIPRGRLASYFLTISVELREVGQAELFEDVPSSMFSSYSITT